jgi:hypothetical protein
MRSHKPHILRRQGSIAKHFDLRAGTKICIVYAHNIESPRTRRWQPPQIFPRYLRHLAPFVPIDRGLGSSYIERRASLNFNETKNIGVPPDQVDFTTAARRAKIARHHHVSEFPQMEECGLFAANTSSQVPRPLVCRKHALSQPVQPLNNRSRDSSRKHDRWRSFNLTKRQASGCDSTHKMTK